MANQGRRILGGSPALIVFERSQRYCAAELSVIKVLRTVGLAVKVYIAMPVIMLPLIQEKSGVVAPFCDFGRLSIRYDRHGAMPNRCLTTITLSLAWRVQHGKESLYWVLSGAASYNIAKLETRLAPASSDAPISPASPWPLKNMSVKFR